MKQNERINFSNSNLQEKIKAIDSSSEKYIKKNQIKSEKAEIKIPNRIINILGNNSKIKLNSLTDHFKRNKIRFKDIYKNTFSDSYSKSYSNEKINLTETNEIIKPKSLYNLRNKTQTNCVSLKKKLNIQSLKKLNPTLPKVKTDLSNDLELFMKKKYYTDVDYQIKNKLRSKVFINDNSIKDRIIEMNKVGVFWGNVFSYCNSIITIDKFKAFKQAIERDKKKRGGKIIISNLLEPTTNNIYRNNNIYNFFNSDKKIISTTTTNLRNSLNNKHLNDKKIYIIPKLS